MRTKNSEIKRLESIGWGGLKGSMDTTKAALLSQYLNNASRFLAALNSDEGQIIFDAAEILAPDTIRLDEDAESLILKIQEAGGGLMAAISRCHLKWVVLMTVGHNSSVASGFENLYEPLVQLMEEGVCLLGIRKGELILGEERVAVPLVGWRNRY